MARNASLSGAQVVIKALVEQGVEVVFGYPGGAVLPLYDAPSGYPHAALE